MKKDPAKGLVRVRMERPHGSSCRCEDSSESAKVEVRVGGIWVQCNGAFGPGAISSCVEMANGIRKRIRKRGSRG